MTGPRETRSLVPVFIITLIILGLFASVPTVRSSETTSRALLTSSQSIRSPASYVVLGDSNVTQTFGLGALPEEIADASRVTPVYVAGALPTHFDWRQQNGYNWMTSVKNQGGCGSCVAFAAVGALEAQVKIQTNNPSWNIDLSEQHLFSCGGGNCSTGWYLSSALNYLQQYGTPDEACSPYRGASGSCSNSCPDWQSRAYKIASWSWVTATPEAIEAALQNGPLPTRTSGPGVGGHSVVIVGYDSVERYWIVKDSLGPSWGENGYRRIGFGEAGIERSAASIVAAPQPTGHTVTFYTTPASGTITADGVPKPDGAAGSYGTGQRVHVVASPSGGYQFSHWETSGVSVDSGSSAETYMTASNDGWLKAHLTSALSEVTVRSKTIFGADLSGVQVKVDRKNYRTPFSLTLQGTRTFTAPRTARLDGAKYSFVRWEDSETGAAVAAGASFTCKVQSAGKTFYAVYEPPKGTITVQLKDANTRRVLAGASVYLDGVLVGLTDSHGKLVARGVYAGTHDLKITMDGYIDYTATISMKTNRTLRAYMNID